jgi:SAM-dependent methyltransferase
MAWFRKQTGEPLVITMSGIKLGDRLLVLGSTDPHLTAALAVKAGLTGRACMVDESEEASAHAAALVEQDGALVERFVSPMTALPFEPSSFDVAVLRNTLPALAPADRARAAAEVHRVIRPGGRCIVIDDGRRGGLAIRRRGPEGDEQYLADGGAAAQLSAAGFRGVRTLAEREGLIFVEGVKPGQ